MQFADAVQDAAGRDWIRGVFSKLKTNSDRISILYSDPKVSFVLIMSQLIKNEILMDLLAKRHCFNDFIARPRNLPEEISRSILGQEI